MTEKMLDDLINRTNKVQGILSTIEDQFADRDSAARIMTQVLDIFDAEVETDAKGNVRPKDQAKATLARHMTDWLKRAGPK